MSASSPRKPRRTRRPDYITGPAPTKRSLEHPMWWLLGAALIAWPLLRDATATKMSRNRYANLESCSCAYSRQQCEASKDDWVGPWYPKEGETQDPGNPGRGKDCSSSSRGYYGGFASTQDDRVRGPTGVEHGYRGGFGGTGRVRAAGS
jgi:hypothetical protein